MTILVSFGNDKREKTLKYNFNLGRIFIEIYPINFLLGESLVSNNIYYKEYSLKIDFLVILSTTLFYFIFICINFFIIYLNYDYQYFQKYHLRVILFSSCIFFTFFGGILIQNSNKLFSIIKYKLWGYSDYVNLIQIIKIYDFIKQNNNEFIDILEYYKKTKLNLDKLSINTINQIYLLVIYLLKTTNHLHSEIIDIYNDYLVLLEKKINPLKTNFINLYYIQSITTNMEDHKNSIKYIDLALNKITKKNNNEYSDEIKELLSNKAYFLIFLERYDESINISKKLLKNNSKDSSSLDNLGLALVKKDNLEEGFIYINQALELDKNKAGFYYTLGLYHYKKKEYNKALENFKKSKQLDKYYTKSDIYISKLFEN